MGESFFEADRELAADYLTPVRSGVTTADSTDLIALRNDVNALFIEVFKETTVIISARFSTTSDSITLRIVYYFKAQKTDPLSVAGMSESVTITPTNFTVEQGSPPGNIFLGQDELFPMRGTKFAKVFIQSITGEVDILAGTI